MIGVEESDVSDLLTYVIPLLKQIGTVHFSDELERNIIDEPLTVPIHFRGPAKRIKGKLYSNIEKQSSIKTAPSKLF